MDPMPDDDGGVPDDDDGGIADVIFTDMERAMVATLTPLPALPPDPTNAVADNADAAALGQMLFYETSYSGALSVDSDLGLTGETGKISCFSCHSGPYLDDQRSQPRTVSLGAGFHTRNAPTTINSVFYQWTNWGGRFSAPWELPIAVVESPVIMNSTRLRLAHVIFDTYRTEYEAVFGAMEPAIGSDATRFPASGKPAAMGAPPGVWEGMTQADRDVVDRILSNFGKAIEAYLRKLVSRNAPFDRFVAGDDDALDQSEKRGLRLFLGEARCFSCHNGPLLSDNEFHNLGVPQTGERVPASDDGRFKDIPPLVASPFNSAGVHSDDTTTGRLLGVTNPPPESTRGQFRTPSLRGVALTPPYMHSGQLPTLQAVISFYAAGGGTPVSGVRDAQMVPLDLDRRERADLIAFLGALTGDAIPAALLADTSK
jgi:cytochrome c peroxidase